MIGLCGYTALLIEFFGLAPLFMMLGIGGLPFVLLWYGLYFGILGRDCAEVASDWMVSHTFEGQSFERCVASRCDGWTEKSVRYSQSMRNLLKRARRYG